MSTKLTRAVKLKTVSLKSTAPETYWSILAQLYRSYRSDVPLEPLGDIIKERDFNRLLDLADSWSSQQYTTAYEHYMMNQFSYLVKKQVLPSKYNPEERAKKLFRECEADMARVNRRFNAWCIDTDFGVSATRRRYNILLRKMRSFIAYLLGDEVPLRDVLEKVGFGPGASIGVSGNKTNAMRKLMAITSKCTVTPRAFTYLAAAVHENLWLRRGFTVDPDGHSHGGESDWAHRLYPVCEFVRYNKIVFVPKTAKIHRSIAVEPLGNSVLQKGADLVMRERLKRIGIDLSNQEINQEFARKGSLPGYQPGIATVDLSSASNRNSRELVRKLFPAPWFELLNSLRSEHYELDGERHEYEMFSSMGNGTTFPLETIIFVAACVACDCGRPGKDFSVYGDDIAIPSCKARDVIRLLRVLGHRANASKTFVTGLFRESCGEDWFGGESVRPFVFDYLLDSVQNVFKFLNQTKARPHWAEFFEPCRQYVLRLLPSDLRLFRPFKGQADSGIDGETDEVLTSPNCRFDKTTGLWSWRELAVVPVRDDYYTETSEGRLGPHAFVQWYGVHTLRSAGHSLSEKVRVGDHGEFPTWFDLRNVTRTNVTRKRGAGATSNWLPLAAQSWPPKPA